MRLSTTRPARFRIQGGAQYSEYPTGVKSRDYSKQWLSGPDAPKRGDLRVVHFDDALDYVCGEAHCAYPFIAPGLWVRHLLFVKGEKEGMPPYVLVCDEVEAGEQPAVFAWQLHSAAPISAADRDLTLQGKQARVDVRLLGSRGRRDSLEANAGARWSRTARRTCSGARPDPCRECAYLAAIAPAGRGRRDLRSACSRRKAAGRSRSTSAG